MKMAKSILKQVLKGLVRMHENGVAHGDLKMGNMLFSVKNVEGEVWQEGDLDDRCVAWPVEGESENVPKCLYAAQPLTGFVDMEDFTVKISDFGGGKLSLLFCFPFSDEPYTDISLETDHGCKAKIKKHLPKQYQLEQHTCSIAPQRNFPRQPIYDPQN